MYVFFMYIHKTAELSPYYSIYEYNTLMMTKMTTIEYMEIPKRISDCNSTSFQSKTGKIKKCILQDTPSILIMYYIERFCETRSVQYTLRYSYSVNIRQMGHIYPNVVVWYEFFINPEEP